MQATLLSVAFALGTLVVGWLVVPALAAFWGSLARKERHAEPVAALAAGFGWSGLLIWTATQGPIGELARRTAGVMGISSWSLVLVAIGFSVALAWSAAAVAKAVSMGMGNRERGTTG
jgi:hypothetical protein